MEIGMAKHHIFLSQDFFPKIGGAHLWMYEIYKRWKTPLDAVVQDYAAAGDSQATSQKMFDSQNHGAFRILRKEMDLDNPSLMSWHCLKKIRDILRTISQIRRHRQVVIHTIRAFPEGFIGLVYKLLHPFSCQLVTYVHGEEVLIASSSRQLYLQTRLVYKFSDLVIANSRSSVNIVHRFFPKVCMQVVHPGVDKKKYNVSEDLINRQRESWGAHKREIVVFSIARMERRKNHASVIRAIARLQKKGVKIKGVFAGDGEEKNNLEKIVRQNRLQNMVCFPGYLTEQEKIIALHACDIHVMVSFEDEHTTEGFGIVFLEAAAAGVPSIAGNAGGQPEAVRDGVTGYVVNGSNIDELADAMEKLCADPTLRRQMGKAGQKWAAENDWDVGAKRIYQHVQSLQ